MRTTPRPSPPALLAFLLLAALPLGGCARGGLAAGGLRCERLVDPLGVDAARPRLSWVLTSGERGQRQTAYRVLAASTPEALARDRGDLWDSGKVPSAEQLEVIWGERPRPSHPYGFRDEPPPPIGGSPLRSRDRVHWKVRVWDRDDRPSGWSEPALFEVGLLEPAGWTARWVALDRPPPASPEEFYADRPAPLLRKEFSLPEKRIARARLYGTGLGFVELYLNGRKVGADVLDPPWTDYRKRVFYAVHDVTAALRPGPNALGAMLGSGWYDPLPLRMWGGLDIREHLSVGEPRAIVQLEVEYADGTRETVASDGTWKAAGGPVLRNSVYLGETYDARRERPGWDRPGFDDAGWAPAKVVDGPGGALRARPIPPVRGSATLPAVKVTEPSPGTFIFDVGRNISGRPVLRVSGPAGTRVVLRSGELLRPDGSLDPLTAVCGQIKGPGVGGPGAPPVAWQADTYVLKGGGVETWSPRFTFHGFRYIEVTGFPGRPEPAAVSAEILHADLEPAGLFACSDELFDRIRDAVRWTFLNNLFAVQSDCPHREKFGYGGDIVATSEAAMLLLDLSTFYAKAVRDFSDAARPDGGLTETAPFVGISDGGLAGKSGPIGWGTVHPLLLRQLHRYYGERRLVEEEYATAKRWVEFLAAHTTKDGTIDRGIGDHESLEPKPIELTGTAFLWWNASLASELADILDKGEDVGRWQKVAAAARDAFDRKFVDPATGRVGPGTQTAQAFALYLRLLPDELRAKALAVLAADIEAHGGHLTTGIFSTKFMLDVLSGAGRHDLAVRLVGQKTFPGWGHMLERGATSLWEHWEWSDDTFSHDHPMFGSVAEWLFEHVAGLRPARDAVGFDRIAIAPKTAGLRWARASYDSVRGPVEVAWKVEDGAFEMDIAVPPGATAEVTIPARDGSPVLEGGKPADRAAGVGDIRPGRGEVVLSVASGRYSFSSRLP